MIERSVPEDRVFGAEELIEDYDEREADLELIEDLVSCMVCTAREDKRAWCQEMLNRFIGQPVDVYTMTDGNSVYTYLSTTGETFMYVGTYSTEKLPFEEALTARQLALFDPSAIPQPS